jgi:hypothetical protein
MDIQIRKGSGAALLALELNLPMHDWPAYQEFDLSPIDGVGGLEKAYRYGAYGELEGFISDDNEEGNLGRLGALYELVTSTHLIERNWDDIADIHGAHDHGAAFHMIIERALARYQLDYGQYITLPQLALLGDVSERSVRNAIHATGESMLIATRDATNELVVEKMEALRWLGGRRNFDQTVRIGSWGKNFPEKLEAAEIMPFLKQRLVELYSADHLKDLFEDDERSQALESMRYDNAGNACGRSGEHVRQLLGQSIEELSPEDCPLIAQILLIDKAWLTTQVMRARFPEAMKGLEPTRPPAIEQAMSPFNETERSLDIILTAAGIRNGYFDIERRYADRLFPADSFGSRGGDGAAATVELHHDAKNSPYVTDLRAKSEALVSPRKRFSAYFTAHSAKPGDVLRIKRTGERSYELTYLAS